MIAEYDSRLVTYNSLLTAPEVIPETIDTDLSLPLTGKYGSTITWHSTDESLIEPDGTVKRPMDAAENPNVTLTAVVQYGIFKVTKTYSFNVMAQFSTDAKYAERDLDYLTPENYSIYTFDDHDANAVTASLRLPAVGAYGSQIMWESSTATVIAESGRVIRPHWDESARRVTLTATVTYGGSSIKKEFVFTVLPDEMLADPAYMTDEEFFGVWENGRWIEEGKFNYGYPDLSAVGEAAKTGDYDKAKKELLAYMRRRPANPMTSTQSRNTAFVDNILLTGVWQGLYVKYYQGKATAISHEYEKVYIDVKPAEVTKGSVASWKIGAQYNENSSLIVASKEHSNSSLHPRIELTVNGQTRVYTASADTMLRGGENRFANFGDARELEIKMFGDFLGNDTSTLLVQFDFSDLKSNDVVTSPRIILSARIQESYVPRKDILAYFAEAIWDENKVSMGSITDYTYNFNGVPGGNHWLNVEKAELEYFWQSQRFVAFPYAAAEYVYTGDEKYAYSIIWNMMDYLIDTQGYINVDTFSGHTGGGGHDWRTSVPGVVLRGGYPRALDSSRRMSGAWIPIFERILDSRYMSADVCTAVLKNMWDIGYELDRYLGTEGIIKPDAGNQVVMESNTCADIAIFLPEYSYSETLLTNAMRNMLLLADYNFLEDGAYTEATGGYSESVFNNYLSFMSKIKLAGYDLSEDYDSFIHKVAYYNVLLRAPSGLRLAWGDDGPGKGTSQLYESYYTLTRDDEFLFIDTMGKRGTKPGWTSKLYPAMTLAFMRSGWSSDALYAFFTAGSSPGSHAHADMNSLVVTAFGEYLLTDQGFFSYTDDIYRRYGKSTLAHNTVEVNGKSQVIGAGRGNNIVNDWVTNDAYDFAGITSAGYADVAHRRTVTLVKPNFFIVSDLMTPQDDTVTNSYKQLWHMLPTAGAAYNQTNGAIYSSKNGANVMLASPDNDPIYEGEAWYTQPWGQIAEAKYHYYSKENTTGKQTFDAVILPYRRTGQGQVSAERIDMGVPTHEATAMKIATMVDGAENSAYYMLDYEETAQTDRIFEKYGTDAQMALVRESSDGNILEAILNGGTRLWHANGGSLLAVSGGAGNVSFELIGTNLKVTAENVDAEGIEINLDTKLENITFNGTAVKFTQDDGKVTLTRTKSEIALANDSTGNKGGIISGESGGSSGNAGGTGVTNETTEPDVVFIDIEGHWAKEDILDMYYRSLVNGYADKTFAPDKQISRSELTAMAVRTAGLEIALYRDSYADVAEDAWYAGAVQTALDAGIIAKDTYFRPDDITSREEMSKILVNVAKIVGEMQNVPEDYQTAYSDDEDISLWAVPYVRFATFHGLMNGMDRNKFVPKEAATRAQATAMLNRMLK